MLKFLKLLKEYWGILVIIGGAFAAFVILPYRVDAMEKRVADVEEVQDSLYEQTTMIGKWVEQEQKEKEYEKERVSSAPVGFRWDSSKREYVKWN